jgi:hypothetical protein
MFSGVANLFVCVPYKAMYDIKGEVKHKKCWSQSMMRSGLYFSTIINVGTDIAFSLIPMTFLSKIRRPPSKKVVIGGLMTLGLLASALSLAKAVMVSQAADFGESARNDMACSLVWKFRPRSSRPVFRNCGAPSSVGWQNWAT